MSHVPAGTMPNRKKGEPRQEGPLKCTYEIGAEGNPHTCVPTVGQRKDKIMDSALDAIGNTPLIRIDRFAKAHGIECELLAKCEFMNAGGSVKDRIGKRMLQDAEAAGIVTPGKTTLIEPTSGNTGVGVSLAAAVMGYDMIITLPEKMSQEKAYTMEALGAKVIRTPTEAAHDSPDSNIGKALSLKEEIPNAHILDQYNNPGNPLAHYDGTAEEIIYQCDGKVDMVILGVGTGGTITGVARKMKEKIPDCRIVGTDPVGSILAGPGPDAGYMVEGIGYDFIPGVLDREVVDEWVKTEDNMSFNLARDLIRLEGLLCGGSSGSALSGVIAKAKELKKGQRCVVVLPDSVRNYMTKFLLPDWMEAFGFTDHEAPAWKKQTVADVALADPVTVPSTATVADVVAKGASAVVVVDAAGKVAGCVSESAAFDFLTMSWGGKGSSPVDQVKEMKRFKTATDSMSLDDAFRLLKGGAEGPGVAAVVRVDGDNKPTGVLTMAVLSAHIAKA